MRIIWKCKALCLTALLAVALLLSGCAPIDTQGAPLPQTVYASFYPIYALAAGVMEDVPGMELYCLVQPQDGCLRSYSLSDWDAALLSGADLVILGGRGLESFESALATGSTTVLTVMAGMPLIEQGGVSSDDDEESHFTGANPWLFLSVEGAKQICASISAAMAQLDADYAHLYTRNGAVMNDRLDALLAEMRSELDGLALPGAVLLQEGLAYFAEEMGFADYVTVAREAGAEYSGNDRAELFSRVAETGYTFVLVERQAPQSLVDDLTEAGYTVCRVDTLSTRFATEGVEGYFDAMRRNAASLRDALD